jgi:hypothetical protein
MLEHKRVNLSIETKKQIRELTKKIFKDRDKFFDFDDRKVGELVISIDDGTKHVVDVYIETVSSDEAHIIDMRDDDYFEFRLFVNLNYIKTEKGLYNTIYHEVMHLTDPSITTRPSEEYINYNDTDYYSMLIEFRAWTNEILEALYNEVINELSYVNNKNELNILRNTLKNIIAHIADGFELLPKAKILMRKMSGREEVVEDISEVLNKVNLIYPNLSHLTEPIGEEEEIPTYILVLMNFKDVDEERWNGFIRTLKKVYEELIDLIDNSDIK